MTITNAGRAPQPHELDHEQYMQSKSHSTRQLVCQIYADDSTDAATVSLYSTSETHQEFADRMVAAFRKMFPFDCTRTLHVYVFPPRTPEHYQMQPPPSADLYHYHPGGAA